MKHTNGETEQTDKDMRENKGLYTHKNTIKEIRCSWSEAGKGQVRERNSNRLKKNRKQKNGKNWDHNRKALCPQPLS